MKIKKDVKPQFSNMPPLKIRYTLMVPFVGIVDIATMMGFFFSPAAEGHLFMKIFYLFFALVGAGFAVWAFLWHTTIDGKLIRVRPFIGRDKTVPSANLKKAVVYKKKSGVITYYTLVDTKDEEIVKLYPTMKDCSVLLERLKRFGIPVEEQIKR